MFIYYSFTVVTIFVKCFCNSENLVKIFHTITFFLRCMYENSASKTLFQFRFHMFQFKDSFTYIQEIY